MTVKYLSAGIKVKKGDLEWVIDDPEKSSYMTTHVSSPPLIPQKQRLPWSEQDKTIENLIDPFEWDDGFLINFIKRMFKKRKHD